MHFFNLFHSKAKGAKIIRAKKISQGRVRVIDPENLKGLNHWMVHTKFQGDRPKILEKTF